MFQLPLHKSTRKIELVAESNGIGDIIHKKEYVLRVFHLQLLYEVMS